MDTVVWQLLASVICPGKHPVLSAGSQFCMHANFCKCCSHVHAHAYVPDVASQAVCMHLVAACHVSLHLQCSADQACV